MTDTSSSPLQTMTSPQAPKASTWTAAFALGGMVFVAAWLGIWGRPMGFLSAIWPANALLLGLLLQKPDWVRPGAAVGVAIGYISADLITGSRPEVAVLLSLANMAGVGAAWMLMHKQAFATLFMQRQSSALLLFMGTGLSALTSAAIGGPVLTVFFNTPPLQAFSMWFGGEWLNYMIFLPMILGWPTRKLGGPDSDRRHPLLRAMPVFAVIALELTSYGLGGPGALAFSLPALLWCALSYRIFTLTVITAALCLSKIAAISLGSFDFTPAHFLETVSFRMGLSMLVLGPLAVAGSHMARTELMRQLRHAANHDSLTDMLARGAFLKQGQRILERCKHDHQSVAILMLDLDHFKQVNDSYGHAGGDQLLRSFSHTLAQVLRGQDIVGRMGGEEFAVVLPHVDSKAAQEIAERINQATRALRVPAGEQTIIATVSIGLVHIAKPGEHQDLDMLLQHADQALYDAKAAGRDRVEARLL